MSPARWTNSVHIFTFPFFIFHVGYILGLPTKPGLGFDLIESEVEKTMDYTEELGGELYYENDGSVADW